ncbi:lysophospholipase L1-like esterase [Leucobacter komagatae]|uniref:Lysophospholipase L1-like esterase n=1 Tax=Leucobacter komagatae TaxID=55969 RepID=A0A542Y7Y9_9MICO|nr:SGNH/GDSL hydrolase family protein [Leucobacter komagatae]TQL44137.1 lysophospholipase L1-like esterase [Leucobacter komagatae]
MAAIRFVAIGDSFTEGVGDEQPDGSVRGWADLVAQGLADATGEPIEYANLAIRGRLLAPILAEQLEPAIALGPTLLSFNGGGNDMLRPGTDMAAIIAATEGALSRIQQAGIEPLLLAGANPTGGLPSGGSVSRKGSELTEAAGAVAARLGVRFSNNWGDTELAGSQYWSIDRLHLAPVGHHRVAANVLGALGYEAPADWVTTAPPKAAPTARDQLRYTREHVLPWIGRRLTGRSSGDGRTAKYPEFVTIAPRG